MRNFLLRIPEDAEIIEFLKDYAKRHSILKAVVMGIGSFKETTIAYYDVELQKYITMDINKPVEVLSILGNITLAQGEPLPHLHVVLGNRDGSTIGGHLVRGIVLLVELYIQEVQGPPYERKEWKYGLRAWDISVD